MRYTFLLPLIIFGLGAKANSVNHKKRVKTVKAHHYVKVARPVAPIVQRDSAIAVNADELLTFAQAFIGTPYHFAASNPDYGFDCSGFVGYVFHNFNFAVPRSSSDYADYGEKVELEDSMPGDIILFTGTKKGTHKIGHIGIIVCNADNEIKFIHATSGKEHAVTITTMDDHYRGRFVAIRRMFKQSEKVLAAIPEI